MEEITYAGVSDTVLQVEKPHTEEYDAASLSPSDNETTGTAVDSTPETEQPVPKMHDSRIKPAEEISEPPAIQSSFTNTQTSEETIENAVSSAAEINLTRDEIRIEEKPGTLLQPEAAGLNFFKDDKAEAEPAVIQHRVQAQAKNNYLYAALGLMIIIIIFLVSAFLLSDRDADDDKKPAITTEKVNIEPKEEAAQSIPMDTKNETAQKEPAESATVKNTTSEEKASGDKKTWKLKELLPKYGSQTEWDGSSDFIIYNVTRGDELYYITEQFTGNGFDYWNIAKDNKIENPDLIFPEQKIKLKKEYIKK